MSPASLALIAFVTTGSLLASNILMMVMASMASPKPSLAIERTSSASGVIFRPTNGHELGNLSDRPTADASLRAPTIEKIKTQREKSRERYQDFGDKVYPL